MSGGRLLPPEKAVRHAPPLCILGEERNERFPVTTIERLCRRAQLINHVPSMPPRATFEPVPRPIVELLFFESCPSHTATRELVQRIAAEETIDCDVKLVAVATLDDAEQLRFLGSPTMRVNGHDVEPGADSRTDFTLACRIYRTTSGHSGTLAEEWLRAALRRAGTPTPT